MSKVGRVSPWLLLAVQVSAFGKGVTPYLPLNLEPEMESQIERVLILGGRPVMTRPIAAASVIKALPKACKVDAVLCEKVERYLARYMHNRGVTHASVGVARGGGKDDTLPNSYGMSSKSNWQVSGQLYWQPSDYLLLDVGADAYEGRTTFTGSMLSFGGSYAQLDIGFRPHWWSPLSDSSMLMSTEAPTTPSVTLSNYEPFTPLGIRYELFDARMSKSNAITFEHPDGTFYEKSGTPKLFGAHLSIEPASGWSLGLSRLLQYGGAGRPQSPKDLVKGFFNPSSFDNTGADVSFNNQFGNQQASITSSFIFPGKVPFVVYAEYAGEDTSHGKNYLLGNSALSMGIHFPRLFERFDLTVETSEWQNAWYTHSVYQDGMTIDGYVTGIWGADQRTFRNDIGARSNMVRLGWDATFGGLLEVRYRTLQNQNYDLYHYDRYHELSLTYSRPYKGMVLGGEFDTGRDSFGGNFNRVQAFLRYDDMRSGMSAAFAGMAESGLGDEAKGEIFVAAGATRYRVKVDLEDSDFKTTEPQKTGYHFAVGARRAVSEHNDLGTRVEFENIEGHSVVGVRLVDYRYRFNNPLALEGFFGAARYALGTPAYGFYYGVGAQWRDILPHTDLGIDARYYDTLARDHLLPTDPQGPRPDSFYYALAGVVSLTYHF